MHGTSLISGLPPHIQTDIRMIINDFGLDENNMSDVKHAMEFYLGIRQEEEDDLF